MSVILIKKHDENIYNIIKDKIDFDHIGPCYKTDRPLRPTPHYNRVLQAHATMGTPHADTLPDPHNFLKKYSGKKQLKKTSGQRGVKPKMAPVPTVEDAKKYQDFKMKRDAERAGSNFVVENIKTVLKMKPKEPLPKVAVDPYGTVVSTGLEPVYIRAKEFGKIPRYLQRFIEVREKMLKMMKNKETLAHRPKFQYITREEREIILNGLKHNWEELQKEYQTLPILTDTIPKIIRKSKLESDLKQLEKDITLIERHPYIYVYDDNVQAFNN